MLLDPFREKYPLEKAFSFHPFSNRNYKSRLDFFLISTPLLKHIDQIVYPPRIIDLFDHSPVSITISASQPTPPSESKINNTLLDIIGLETLTRVELHLILRDYFSELRSDTLTNVYEELMWARKKFCDLLFFFQESLPTDKLIRNIIDFQILKIENLLICLPPWESIHEMICDIEHDLLLCTISNNLTLYISNLQKISMKKQNSYYHNLCKLYNKEQIAGNISGMKIIEKEIINLETEHISKLLSNSIYFDQIKNEHLTKSLLNLTKSAKNSDSSLKVISRDDGSAFNDDLESKSFISNYYQEIFF